MSIDHCPNMDECINGNRFGHGCVEDAVQSAMGGKPWHECRCGIDSEGNPPNLRQAAEIKRLRAESAETAVEFGILQNDLGKALLEIDRLRAGGCARDQTTTQFCVEAARLAADNDRLRAALEKIGMPGVPERSLYYSTRGHAENIGIARAALGEKA